MSQTQSDANPLKRKRSPIPISENPYSTKETEENNEGFFADVNHKDLHLPNYDFLGGKDPRPILLSMLQFLSDDELSEAVVMRLSVAKTIRPPLFLSHSCVRGLIDFFRPRLSCAIPALLAEHKGAGLDGLARQSCANAALPLPNHPHQTTDPSASTTPFGSVLLTKRDKAILIGLSGTGKYRLPSSLVHHNSLISSLASTLSFLEPKELRALIINRVEAAEEPYIEVKYFLEFLQSGGDGEPFGKRVERSYAEKRRAQHYRRRMNKKGMGEDAGAGDADRDGNVDGEGEKDNVKDLGSTDPQLLIATASASAEKPMEFQTGPSSPTVSKKPDPPLPTIQNAINNEHSHLEEGEVPDILPNAAKMAPAGKQFQEGLEIPADAPEAPPKKKKRKKRKKANISEFVGPV
ncbi:hypothetical protein M422DRAFT_27555 [Sphaerobolus stellatus SS14]|nr:hypothetical protein M422DRAFT_27555 [Sphaerobolus stellatus SS14]